MSDQQNMPESAVTDETKEVSALAPQLSEAEFEGMPAFAPVGKMLPSQRMARNAKLIKLVQSMPEQWRGGDMQVDNVADMDADALVALFEGIEQIVFDLAANEDEMREWIMGQDEPETALMAAFSRAAELLGN